MKNIILGEREGSTGVPLSIANNINSIVIEHAFVL